MKAKQWMVVLIATVSNTALAWTNSGSGGTFEMSGTLTPESRESPWEVKTGGELVLDAKMDEKGDLVKLTVAKGALLLGIRSREDKHTQPNGFTGMPGIAPQIDFDGKLDVDNFVAGKAPLTLDVLDESGMTKIGTLSGPVLGYAESSWVTNARSGYNDLFASKEGMGFWGGLPKSAEQVASNARARVAALDRETPSTIKTVPVNARGPWESRFADKSVVNSGYYGAGFEAGDLLVMTLDNKPRQVAFKWHAILPIVVTYE